MLPAEMRYTIHQVLTEAGTIAGWVIYDPFSDEEPFAGYRVPRYWRTVATHDALRQLGGLLVNGPHARGYSLDETVHALAELELGEWDTPAAEPGGSAS